jgi:hypothetical protein
MKSIRIIIIVLFIAIFLFLIFALYKTYVDVKKSNDYLSYVSSTANDLVAQVESLNAHLNEINYNEADSYIEDLETKRTEFEDAIDEAEEGYKDMVKPYESDEISSEFDEYIAKVKKIYDSFDAIVTTIKNADEKSEFDEKLDEYILLSAELDENSKRLEASLEAYANDYNKIDFNRLIHAIKSV